MIIVCWLGLVMLTQEPPSAHPASAADPLRLILIAEPAGGAVLRYLGRRSTENREAFDQGLREELEKRGKQASVKIDVGTKVPWYHPVHILQVCKQQGLASVELVFGVVEGEAGERSLRLQFA